MRLSELKPEDYVTIAEQVIKEYNTLLRYENKKYSIELQSEKFELDPITNNFKYYVNNKLKAEINDEKLLDKLKKLMYFFNQ